LSTSGVRALVLAIPVSFVGAVVVPQLLDWASHGRLAFTFRLWLVLVAGIVMIVLWFALQNHRSSERGSSMILRQGLALTAVLIWGGLLILGVQVMRDGVF